MIRFSPDFASEPYTVTSVFSGTSVTTNPASLVSTLITPEPSFRLNQQPAIGHFSIILPRITVGLSGIASPDIRSTEAFSNAGLPRVSTFWLPQPVITTPNKMAPRRGAFVRPTFLFGIMLTKTPGQRQARMAEEYTDWR